MHTLGDFLASNTHLPSRSPLTEDKAQAVEHIEKKVLFEALIEKVYGTNRISDSEICDGKWTFKFIVKTTRRYSCYSTVVVILRQTTWKRLKVRLDDRMKGCGDKDCCICTEKVFSPDKLHKKYDACPICESVICKDCGDQLFEDYINQTAAMLKQKKDKGQSIMPQCPVCLTEWQ